MTSIFTPFTTWDEWNAVRINLFFNLDRNSRRWALKQLSIWGSRQKLAHGYDSTLKIMTLLLDIEEKESFGSDEMYFSMALSLALLRFYRSSSFFATIR